MSSADTLLCQILAHPADDQARVVYADLLQSEGDPRGELIAVDLELARAPSRELQARKRALLAEHGPRWWPALPVERIDVVRGFVVRVAGTLDELTAASAMFEHEPIDRVEVCQSGGRFPDHTWQSRIRHLAIRGSLGGEGLLAIASSRLGEQLESLDVGNASVYKFPDLDDAFPALRSFAAADNALLRYDLRALPRWLQLRALERLDLRRLQLGAADLLPIIGKLAQIRELALSGNPIGPDGVFALVKKLAELPELRRLEMRGTGIGAEGVQVLRNALPLCDVDVDMPDAVELDLVGRKLRIEHHAGSLWKLSLDGEQRRVEIAHSVEYDGGRGPTVTHGDSGVKVPLEPLARMLAHGAVRSLERDHVRLQRGSTSGAVYNTSVWTSETVKLAFTPHAVEVTFEEYIDTSS